MAPEKRQVFAVAKRTHLQVFLKSEFCITVSTFQVPCISNSGTRLWTKCLNGMLWVGKK